MLIWVPYFDRSMGTSCVRRLLTGLLAVALTVTRGRLRRRRRPHPPDASAPSASSATSRSTASTRRCTRTSRSPSGSPSPRTTTRTSPRTWPPTPARPTSRRSRRAGSASSPRPQPVRGLQRLRRRRRSRTSGRTGSGRPAPSTDGQVVGLGTDVGGMAMCYRKDLFEQGRPADRPRRGGRSSGRPGRSTSRPARSSSSQGAGRGVLRRPAVMYRAILGQQPVGIYDGADNIVVDTNPAVQAGLGPAARGDQGRPVREARRVHRRLERRLRQGHVRHHRLPVLDDGLHPEQAKTAAGQVGHRGPCPAAAATGAVRGSRAEAEQAPAEAAELANWLTAPEQQAKVFQAIGNFPSTVALYDDPVIKDFGSTPFFNNAPVGQIFSDSVTTLVPQYLGPKSGDINTRIIDGLTRVEQGKRDARTSPGARCCDEGGRAVCAGPTRAEPEVVSTGWTRRASPVPLHPAVLPALRASSGSFPLVYTAWVSLHDWSLLAETHTCIGLENYTRPVRRRHFWNALLNTAQILGALHRAAAAAGAAAGARAQPAAARADVLADERAAAEHHQRGRGGDHLRPALRPGLRPDQLAARSCSASGKIDWQAGTASLADRHLGDDHLAVDRLQRADLPGRDAGRAARTCTTPASLDGASSFQQLRKITVPAIRPDHHLHRHRLHDRRHAGPRRAAAVRRRRR